MFKKIVFCLIFSLLFNTDPPLFAAEILSKIDKVIGETVDSIAQEDQLTGALELNVVQSGNSFITGMKFFLQAEIRNEEQGIYPLPTSHHIYRRARKVYDRIIPATHYSGVKGLKFVVYGSKEFNAYATGGGHIAIFSGLVEKLSDDELASVIGHELAHNAASHSFEKATTLTLGDKVGKNFRVGYKEAFTNVNEQEADRVGILYMALAGIDPYASVTSQSRFITSDLSEYAYFRSHPPRRERAQRNRDTSNRLSQYFVKDRLNPNTEKLLECNILYCTNKDEKLEDGSGGGLFKALELIAVTIAKNQNAKDELSKQKREIAYTAPNVNWGAGWSSFKGTIERNRNVTTGLSFGLIQNQGNFYYNFNGQVLEGSLRFYRRDSNGYWYRWRDAYGTGNLYLTPYEDGSLRGRIYIDDGTQRGYELGKWIGYQSI